MVRSSFYIVSKIKNTVPWTYLINDLSGEEIIGSFYEKEFQKTSQKEKVLKRKGDKLYVKWIGYDNRFNSCIDKKDRVATDVLKWVNTFLSLKSFGRNINVKVDLSNYATKTDLKNVTHVDTSSFALKTNLTDLKTEVDKLDIDRVAPVLTDLSKLSNVVKNDVKKTVYDKLVAKVDDIDTNDFVLKTKCNTDKTELENKIPNVIGFVKKPKLNELENKIPSFSNLVNKTDYKTKVREIENKLTNHNHDKYIDTQEFNKLAADVFNARLIAQAKLITKTKVDAKLSSLNKKITLNKTKHLLIENELNKLKTFDSSYFIELL